MFFCGPAVGDRPSGSVEEGSRSTSRKSNLEVPSTSACICCGHVFCSRDRLILPFRVAQWMHSSPSQQDAASQTARCGQFQEERKQEESTIADSFTQISLSLSLYVSISLYLFPGPHSIPLLPLSPYIYIYMYLYLTLSITCSCLSHLLPSFDAHTLCPFLFCHESGSFPCTARIRSGSAFSRTVSASWACMCCSQAQKSPHQRDDGSAIIKWRVAAVLLRSCTCDSFPPLSLSLCGFVRLGTSC